MTELPPESPVSSGPPTAAPSQPGNTSSGPAQPLFPGVVKPQPEELILEWQALSRPYKPRNRQYFTTIAIFVGLISLILFFSRQFLPIAVVVAVGFIAYVLEMVPPTTVTHRLTTYGVRIEDSLYYWEELGRFWFTERYGHILLNIEVSRFPGRLTMLMGNLTQADLQPILSEVLLFQRPQPTTYEQLAERLQRLIPLE